MRKMGMNDGKEKEGLGREDGEEEYWEGNRRIDQKKERNGREGEEE